MTITINCETAEELYRGLNELMPAIMEMTNFSIGVYVEKNDPEEYLKQ